jgi:hypothetical protein
MFMVASAKNFTSFFSSIMYMPVARRTSGRMPRICSAGRIVSGYGAVRPATRPSASPRRTIIMPKWVRRFM